MKVTSMTTATARSLYQCNLCREGNGECVGDSPEYGYQFDCVEAHTGSTRCISCNNRVWFPGTYPKPDTVFECPYCGASQIIKHM